MIKLHIISPLVCLLILAAAAALAAGDKEFLDWPEPAGFPPYVLSGSEARLAGPPQFVHGGRTESVAWSSGGRYLSLLTEEVLPQSALDTTPRPGAPAELSVWDSTNGKVRRLIREGGSVAQIYASRWLPASSVIIATITQPATPGAPAAPLPPRRWLVRLDAGSGRLTPLVALSHRGSPAFSTLHPAAIALTADDRVALVRSDGPMVDLTDRILKAAGEGAMVNRLTARSDGQLLVAFYSRRSGKNETGTVEVDPRHATARLLQPGLPAAGRAPLAAPARQDAIFAVQLARSKVASPAGEKPIGVALLTAAETSPRPAAVLALDAELVQLSPAGAFAAYVTGEGACYVRRLHKMDRADLVAARLKAVQTGLVARGNMLGAALEQYVMDHDGALPPAGSFNLLVGDYLKNHVDDFIYTSNGGPYSGIAKPGQTEAGYLLGPGGKSVVYHDGQARWVDDP